MTQEVESMISDFTATEMEGFQHIAQSLPCIAWTADAFGEVMWYNRDFYDYSGLTPQWVASRSWLSLVHPADRQEITRAYAHAITSGTVLSGTVRLCGAQGDYRWFSARARPLTGENPQWLGTLTDIHDQQTTSLANAHVVDALMKGYLIAEFPESKNVRFDAFYAPANDVEKLGGDWYDVFPLPGGRFGFSIGDVCGHGIDAAVKMGEAKQAVFVAASLEDSVPESVLRKANDVLFLRKDHILTTALYGVIDPARRTVTYASAGHHPPIFASPERETAMLPNHGFPLGVEERMPPCKVHEFSYDQGSILLLYTDGLIEYGRNLLEGEARLIAAASEALRRKPEHPARFIVENALGETHPSDDVAVLTLSFWDE